MLIDAVKVHYEIVGGILAATCLNAGHAAAKESLPDWESRFQKLTLPVGGGGAV